ncbi:hypothetical protein [Streptomyces sp. NPDC014734]|uniref:hypothetical protein n=1 Tax=Streptomyces sp. NPDC014734 TaxID=3364886 RepID=UPI0036F64EA5
MLTLTADVGALVRSRQPEHGPELRVRGREDSRADRRNAEYVVEHLGAPGAVLIVDDTGFLKKGTWLRSRLAGAFVHEFRRKLSITAAEDVREF